MLRVSFVSLIVFFTFISCKNIVYVRDYSQKTTAFNPNLKIALVGFYPYQYITSSYGRTRTTTATLDYNHPTVSVMTIGKPIDLIPSNGIDSSVSPEASKDVAMTYLERVKISGLQEISKMIEIKKVDEKTTFALKKRDVDYYLIAIHGPAFDESWPNLGRGLLTVHLCMVTIGTIPCWRSLKSETKFLLYDNKLNLVESKSYSDRYEHLGAWWGEEDQGSFNPETTGIPDPLKVKVYKPHILEYEDHLKELLNK
ncbi:hypothetical protein ND860_03190 [Leptospira levettii]|uniref:Lipoprotein n=1 Tax=Leptospira levettii TaxID=2023178 RepID=A0AAW5VA47_9LEPT|nr:hypothetical protein [Leptospira levettii]MCW7464415.1 hypothetical protein [Leptospira levettii]MCW7495516.1 hypothetical protein [Leptospira levettii]MCW7511400.1 hypothetical protein [Leptospira levettii]MCW7515155.1 hypothetical protein [Leptospira levettii]TGM93288.1 hypothetical protein EHR02_11095 [Leptospira levettii]